MTTLLTGWKRIRGHADIKSHEARFARQEAERALLCAQARTQESLASAERLRELREKNHFAEMLLATMRTPDART